VKQGHAIAVPTTPSIADLMISGRTSELAEVRRMTTTDAQSSNRYGFR